MNRKFTKSAQLRFVLVGIVLAGVVLGTLWIVGILPTPRGFPPRDLKQSSADPSHPATAGRDIQTAALPIKRTLHATSAKGEPLIPVILPADRAIDFREPLGFDARIAILQAQIDAIHPVQIENLAAFVRTPHLAQIRNQSQSAVEIDAAKSEIKNSLPLTPEEMRALKNDVLNLLARQEGYRDQLAALLRAVHDDQNQDAALRDYALQFLAGLMQDGRLPADYAIHWQVVEGKDPALAATALLHLLSASREKGFPAADVRKLADAASRLAADPTQPAPSRATALQVCGRLGNDRALPIAYALARSEQESFPLRIAAVATLGDLAAKDPAIREYLRQLAVGPEQRLRVPAESALQRLDHSKS